MFGSSTVSSNCRISMRWCARHEQRDGRRATVTIPFGNEPIEVIL